MLLRTSREVYRPKIYGRLVSEEQKVVELDFRHALYMLYLRSSRARSKIDQFTRSLKFIFADFLWKVLH